MLTEALTHGNALTFDPDYGPFAAPKAVVRYDWTIRRYRWMVVQEMAPSTQRVTPADPDAQLGEERALFKDEERSFTQWRKSGSEALIRKGERKQLELRNLIMAHLIEHGPRHIMGLVHDLELPYSGIEIHIKMNQGTIYHAVGKARTTTRKAVLWGVVGVHEREG